MNYIVRFAEKDLRGLISEKEIVAVTGPRQAGKTTLIQHVLTSIPNSVSYTFDNQSLAKEFKNSPDSFYERYMKGKSVVFLDEIQYIKNSGKILKYLYDTYTETKIIVSGSSAPDISIQSLKFLVGRVFILEVMPFSLQEFISYKKPDIYKMIEGGNSVDQYEKELQLVASEYMIYGGYPKVVTEDDYAKKEVVLENIYNTLFLKEIRDLAGLVEVDSFSDLLKSLALIQGSQVEYKKLSDITGYSFTSIKKYIKLLEHMYLCIRVSPFFKNKLKEISKSSKIYFLDSGIRNYILHDFRSFTDISARQDIGAVLEQTTVRALGAPTKDIKYWRDKNQNEIDFVVEGVGLVPELYECKWKFQPWKQKALESFVRLHQIPSIKKVVCFPISSNRKLSEIDDVGIWSV